MEKIIKRCLLGILLINMSVFAFAQKAISRETILIEKEVISESTIKLISITNKSGYSAEIIIEHNDFGGSEIIVLEKDATWKPENSIICTNITAQPRGTNVDDAGGGPIWIKKDTKKEWEKTHPKKNTSETAAAVKQSAKKETAVADDKKAEPAKPVEVPKERADAEKIARKFKERLERESYWSQSSIENDLKEIDNHVESLKNWADKEQYIKSKELTAYIKEAGKKIDRYKEGVDAKVNDFIEDCEKKYIIEDDVLDCKEKLRSILHDRLQSREDAVMNLKAAIEAKEEDKESPMLMYGINALVILVIALLLFLWFRMMAKRKINKTKQAAVVEQASDGSPAIVVRRKTTSILKKQSLEDVVDNDAYLKIECTDFCNDSAVRRIYLKNTCVKDIYNMYADDLRNPDNPKEDGCMVLGRWVHDEQANEYYVSLEEIVRPGDDAVFQEYELNFGGKIKLRVAEKLRKLRRDTNLQYDLTCWVHSHPGLGVFFSNSDTGVQMQLKHPSHPNFLVAFVVDILTPQQELGIFTFKHDSSINSRNDLKKVYSLEELYKWAVESDRNSYKPDDYYNVLSKAESVGDECQSIQLSNGAIIDISSMTTEQNTGLAGFAFGFKANGSTKNEYVINSVSKEQSVQDNELMGCLIIGTHCSIPSIRKAVAEYMDRIKFVMFYSVKDETITAIPVVDMQLAMDEKYYAEEKIEDLKIWTRRKR